MRARSGLRRAAHVSPGFSLVELLVVIGIIGVLLALLFPVISSVRRAAAATKCLANLQQWIQSYHLYLNGNGGSNNFDSATSYNDDVSWLVSSPWTP